MKRPSHLPPICFYPLTTVFVDDDKKYLDMIKYLLDAKGDVLYIVFSNANKAVNYIKEHHKKEFWLRECLTSAEDEDYNKPNLQGMFLHIDRLIKRLNNPNRYSEICMIVTDYKMPEGTGLEFIELLENTPIYKAMLTGVLPLSGAIDSFNKRLFDVYLNKDEHEIAVQLIKYIKQASMLYFNDFTNEVLKFTPKLKNVLSDEKFIDFFNKYIDANNIAEGYLIDDFGSYLFLDKDANGKIFAVLHEDDFKAYEELLNTADNIDKHRQLLDQIKSRTKLPYFYNQDIDKIELPDWTDFLHPTKRIDGSQIYYTVIEDIKRYGVNLDDVLSFNEYLDKQNS